MKKLQKKSLKLAKFIERSPLCIRKVQVEAASADVEDVASYLKDLAKIINEDGYVNRFF